MVERVLSNHNGLTFRNRHNLCLQGKEPPLTLRRENQSVFWATFSPVRRGLFPVVRDFLCIIPTEQVLYYRNLGLYYGLASGTLPLYSGPCLGVKGGCVSCDMSVGNLFATDGKPKSAADLISVAGSREKRENDIEK